MQATSLSQLVFQPLAKSIPLDAVESNYVTPISLREQLLNMAFINGVQALASFYLEHDSTEGTAVVRLTDGVSVALETTVDLSSSPAQTKQIVDLSRYTSASFLYWEIETTVAGSTGAVGALSGKITIQTPLFVSSDQC